MCGQRREEFRLSSLVISSPLLHLVDSREPTWLVEARNTVVETREKFQRVMPKKSRFSLRASGLDSVNSTESDLPLNLPFLYTGRGYVDQQSIP